MIRDQNISILHITNENAHIDFDLKSNYLEKNNDNHLYYKNPFDTDFEDLHHQLLFFLIVIDKIIETLELNKSQYNKS